MTNAVHPIHTFRDFAVSDRDGIPENRHLVHAAVVDADGRLLWSVGDPSRVTLIRSAAKPAQTLAILSTPGIAQYGFSDKDVALMCASHSAEPIHLVRANFLLKAGGNTVWDLKCGPHPAIVDPGCSDTENARWAREGTVLTGVHNNCSGKHGAMLAAARIDDEVGIYHQPESAIQQRVKDAVEELAGEGEVRWAVDGCNLPAPAMELTRLARMFAQFAAAADTVDSDAEADEQTRMMARIFTSMSKYPELGSGSNRFCAALMRAYAGRLIGKVGADGCYGVGIRAGEYDGPGSPGVLGIAVKVEDGDREVLYATVVEILERIGVGSALELGPLDKYQHVVRRNTAGEAVGTVSMPWELRKW